MTTLGTAAGVWIRAERIRLSGVLGLIATPHLASWVLYFYYPHNLVAAGTAACGLGMRHAFDVAPSRATSLSPTISSFRVSSSWERS